MLLGVAGVAAMTASAADGPKFEVASVKPVLRSAPPVARAGQRGTGGGCPLSLKMDRGRVEFQCATLVDLIGYAFRISPDRVAGPDWMTAAGADRFEIAATLPPGAPLSQVPEMVQALLAERFHLALHRGTAVRSVNALVLGKGGPKLEKAAAEPEAEAAALFGAMTFFGNVTAHPAVNAEGAYTALANPRMGTVRETEGPGPTQRWDAPNITLAGLADLLDKVTPLSSPVVDMTELSGRYRVTLEVSLKDLLGPRPAAPAIEDPGVEMEAEARRAFNDGLRNLGLELVIRKGPVETVMVDRADRSPTGN